MKRTLLIVAAFAVFTGGALAIVLSVTGEDREPIVGVPGGDPEAGKAVIEEKGCGSCHTIAGIDSTDKYIGPPLVDFAERRYIAGDEPNRLDVLIEWLLDPQSVEPGTIMPDLGLTSDEARDVAAYLYSDP